MIKEDLEIEDVYRLSFIVIYYIKMFYLREEVISFWGLGLVSCIFCIRIYRSGWVECIDTFILKLVERYSEEK